MSLSLIIYEHPTSDETHALVATHDPQIIAAVRRMLMVRLGEAPAGNVLPLPRLARRRPSKQKEGA